MTLFQFTFVTRLSGLKIHKQCVQFTVIFPVIGYILNQKSYPSTSLSLGFPHSLHFIPIFSKSEPQEYSPTFQKFSEINVPRVLQDVVLPSVRQCLHCNSGKIILESFNTSRHKALNIGTALRKAILPKGQLISENPLYIQIIDQSFQKSVFDNIIMWQVHVF